MKRKDKREMLQKENALVDMKAVLEIIYKRCFEKDMQLVFSDEAEEIYEEYHDTIVEFRKEARG